MHISSSLISMLHVRALTVKGWNLIRCHFRLGLVEETVTLSQIHVLRIETLSHLKLFPKSV